MSRMFCNPNHKLSLSITETKSKTEIARIEKPFKCCCPACLPCFLKEASVLKVEGGNPVDVGLIKQPWCGGFFTPMLDVYDKKPEDGGVINGTKLYIDRFHCCHYLYHYYECYEHLYMFTFVAYNNH